MTYGLIAANAIVFVGELIYTNGFDSCLTGQLFYSYGLVPFSVLNQAQLSLQCSSGHVFVTGYSPAVYFSVLSSMFLHVSYLHIFGNMLFLFVFGPNVESRLGRVKYFGTYLAS
ncbi:MAG TPA: rhomboid family intramembrane serine protease, partial [Nitrososphaerales archaeon]|nr:rhomboid family intramembrane serine protease [Nitrososphaerales archaeon]